MQTKLILSAALFLVCAYLVLSSKKERFGYPLDDICMSVDCNTPEGKKSAMEKCNKMLEMAKQAYPDCMSNDPEININCPVECKMENVPDYIINKNKARASANSCAQPLQEGEDQAGNKYCKNANGSWIRKPAAKK